MGIPVEADSRLLPRRLPPRPAAGSDHRKTVQSIRVVLMGRSRGLAAPDAPPAVCSDHRITVQPIWGVLPGRSRGLRCGSAPAAWAPPVSIPGLGILPDTTDMERLSSRQGEGPGRASSPLPQHVPETRRFVRTGEPTESFSYTVGGAAALPGPSLARG